MTVTIDQIHVADSPDAWAAAGFGVGADAVCQVGRVGLRLIGPAHGSGIIGWSLRGLPSDRPVDDLDGIPTTPSAAGVARPATHPNGVVAIDHVVMMSPNLDRTVEALATFGVEPRRERNTELGGHPIRQIFFRFGEVIVEVVGPPEPAGAGPASLWGITYLVDDVEETATFFGESTTPIKDAVQPGRRITTLRHRELGLSVRTAMISAGR